MKIGQHLVNLRARVEYRVFFDSPCTVYAWKLMTLLVIAAEGIHRGQTHCQECQTTDLYITGCAVAQHCYNGDVSFLWEKWKL